MFKIIILLIALFTSGYLIVQENWSVTITGFGYEVTISTVLLFILALILWYVFYLIKQPFSWVYRFKNKRANAHLIKKEGYLTFVLETILDKNNISESAILNKKKGLLEKNDVKNLLLTALFNPSQTVFEELSKIKETELAGLRGLFLHAKKEGDLKEAGKMLLKAEAGYPHVSWIIKERFELATLLNDWDEALTILETLKKEKIVSKEEYATYKATLLFKAGHVKEAYALDKTNPAIALVYAEQNPDKAKSILALSWEETPSWEVYQAYSKLLGHLSKEKRLKAIKKLTASNASFRISYLAVADMAIQNEFWSEAKEYLESYLEAYPLTKQVASMMATVIRKGWHHEAQAKEWEQKALEAEDKFGWYCTACNHETFAWDAQCPECNALGAIKYR